jgi:hypothetical protein
MYSPERVNFTDAEHARAEKADKAIESILAALDDGFQPLQDLADIGVAAWAFADIVRTTAQEFEAANGRMPRAAEIGEMVGNYFLMLNRDNRWLARGVGATSNE